MNQKNYKSNKLGLNSCFLNKKNPFELFKAWMVKAKKSEINDPNALALATVNRNKQPSVRMVLLKELTNKEFIFYTNLNSKKSNELKSNPKASMCFHWKSIRRQIRIEGSIKKVPSKVADKYFNSRPYGSRIGAWASPQSEAIPNRDFLEEAEKRFNAEFGDTPPRPEHWGGYRLHPTEIEFWQGRPSRLHDRMHYKLEGQEWRINRLAP